MPLRVLFFGTPSFAVPTLDALLASPDAVVAGVVTQPDKPRGRGQQVSASPVKARRMAACRFCSRRSPAGISRRRGR